MISSFKKIVGGTLFLLALFAAYAFLSSVPTTRAQSDDSSDDSGSASTDSTGTTASPSDIPGGTALESTIEEINSMKLDGSFFQNPAFRSLEDKSVIIPQEPVGRSDPFVPFNGEAAPTVAATK